MLLLTGARGDTTNERGFFNGQENTQRMIDGVEEPIPDGGLE